MTHTESENIMSENVTCWSDYLNLWHASVPVKNGIADEQASELARDMIEAASIERDGHPPVTDLPLTFEGLRIFGTRAIFGYVLSEERAYEPSPNPEDFDHADRLNDDGTVTLRMTPSAWHAYNMSPDTYQSFNGDSWLESQFDWINERDRPFSEHFGDEWAWVDGCDIEFGYEHFKFDYDHAAIVRDLAEELTAWMGSVLFDAGLESASVKLLDTWSPAFYNFTSDGFEVEVTCDPAELRGLTADFDADDWAAKHYRSYDGFRSFVTGRMDDADWHAEYDGGFRVESLFANSEDHDVIERGWVIALAEAEYEVYSQNVAVTPDEVEIRESVGYEESGLTLRELEEWAEEFMAVYRAGMEPLPLTA